MRGLTLSFITASAIAGLSMTATAQPQQAGVSAAVRGQVALARVSENVVGRQVQSGDPIFLGDAISSGKASGLQIMLLDETVFSIGPNSEIAIDEFVYDPETNSGKVTASVAKGVFRFITGKIARKRPEDMTVRLPTATIGIRGTIVAGAVRTEAGGDASVDQVFAGLKGVSPNAENARDFVVLLGPGHENNTNDQGGAFVFVPRGPEQALRGRSAGAAAPGGPGGGFGDGGVTISRTGTGVVGFGPGTISEPFTAPPGVTQGFTSGLSAQPPAGPKGSSSDSDAQEASNAGDADSLSGNSIAEAAGESARQAGLTEVAERGGDIIDPTAGSGDIFDFNDLRAISSGSAVSNGGFNLGTAFNVLNSQLTVNYGNQTFQFDLNTITNINGGASLTANVGCFGACSVDYGGRSGPAVFTIADANPAQTSGCDSCSLTMQFTTAETVNVTLEHAGDVGSATRTLTPQ